MKNKKLLTNFIYVLISFLISISGAYLYFKKTNINPLTTLFPGEKGYEARFANTFNEQRTSGLFKYEANSTIKSWLFGSFNTISKTNSLGYSDEEFNFSDEKCNVLVFGDSYVASHQVPIELKFFRLLETLLEEKYQIDFSVHGTGMDGTAAIHQTEFINDVTKTHQFPVDFFIAPLVLNDVRDSFAPLDFASHNRYVRLPDFQHPLSVRRSVYAQSDNSGYYVINPASDDYGLSETIIDHDFQNTIADWNDRSYKVLRRLNELKVIDELKIAEESLETDAIIEYHLGLDDIGQFWKSAANAYDFSIGYLMDNTPVTPSNTGVFTTHGVYIYNDPSNLSVYNKRIERLVKPWERRGFKVSKLDSEDYNFNLQKFPLQGDGHLSILGHEMTATFIMAELGERIFQTCSGKKRQ